MREIKYKAYHRKDKKIYNVLHIYWMEDNQRVEIPSALLEDNRLNYPKWRDGEDIDLMEYIGQIDSNGRLIYEGFLLKIPSHSKPFEVRYLGSGFWGVNKEYNDLELIANNLQEAVIVGNIYENPELLEE